MSKYDCWFEAGKTEVAHAVVSLVDSHADVSAGRRERDRIRLVQYVGRQVSELDGRAFVEGLAARRVEGNADDELDAGYRIACHAIEAIVAKVAAKQRPEVEVLASGAKYADRIRGRKLAKALRAPLYQRHGRYPNGWALMLDAFRDSLRSDAGVVKVVGDLANGRISYERHHAHQFLVDELEASDGCPRSLFHRYPRDRHYLASLWPEHEHAIMESTCYYDRGTVDSRTLSRTAVYEAWRLPLGPGQPGRHVICIEGGGSPTTLVDEPWEWDEFPVLLITPKPNAYGIWNDPAIDTLAKPQDDANEFFGSLNTSCRLLSVGTISYEEGMINKEALAANDIWNLMPRTPGSQPPVFQVPPPFPPALLEYAERVKSFGFEFLGVNELMAQGQRMSGAVSGKAIRTENMLQSEVFLPYAQCYEDAFVTLGRLTMRVGKDLAKTMEADGRKFTLSRPDEDIGATEDYDWADVDMDLDSIDLRIVAVSSYRDTLASRLETLAELAEAGQIPPEVYQAQMMRATPDLEAMERRLDPQDRYMRQLIARWEEAEENEEFEMPMPDPLFNLPMALTSAVNGYRNMKADGADEYKTALADQWIQLCTEAIAKTQPQQPPAGAPMPGAGPQAPAGPPQGAAPMPGPMN